MINEPVPDNLDWLQTAPLEDKVDWLIDRRLEQMRKDRTSGRFYRTMSYIAIVLVFMGLWLTVNNTRTDAKRVAAAESRRINADGDQVVYAQCISTANGRAAIRDVLTILISRSEHPDDPGTKRARDILDDPNGPLAPPICTPPIPIPGGP